MKFLLSQFEDQLQAEIDDQGTISIGNLSYTPKEILLKVDPDAFSEAFREWFELSWLSDVISRADSLLKLGSNSTRFQDLASAIEKQLVIPFVGSGMSVPSGMKTWTGFLRELLTNTSMEPAEFETLLNQGEFEKVASQLRNHMTRQLFDESFTRVFKTRTIESIRGPVRWLPYLFDASVLTTNFDDILERCYEDCSLPFATMFQGTDIGQFRTNLHSGDRCLLKLHGTIRIASSRVLTESEYEKFYRPRSNCRKQLQQLFSQRSMLFLGCGLSSDRTMEVLKYLADRDEHSASHFAILPLPLNEDNTLDDERRIQREHWLTERNIFPIWYQGEHNDCIEALMVKLLQDTGRLNVDLETIKQI